MRESSKTVHPPNSLFKFPYFLDTGCPRNMLTQIGSVKYQLTQLLTRLDRFLLATVNLRHPVRNAAIHSFYY